MVEGGHSQSDGPDVTDEEKVELRERDAARQPGFYWVKHFRVWEVAEWRGSEDPRWLMVNDWIAQSDHLDAIHEQRLTPPE